MKKTYIYLICVIVIILAIILGKYYNYRAKISALREFNLEYEYVEVEVEVDENGNEIGEVKKDK